MFASDTAIRVWIFHHLVPSVGVVFVSVQTREFFVAIIDQYRRVV
jgi:hypothetical protein